MMSLLPEKPLVFSPQLAATLGLEEAILLQALNEVCCHLVNTQPGSDLHSQSHNQPHNPFHGQWIELDAHYLSRLLPFWSLQDILRIALNLKNQGVLHTAPPSGKTAVFRFALNDSKTGATEPLPVQTATRGTQPITPSWQPEPDVVAQLTQYGVPPSFINKQIPEFITYWGERGEPHYSWGSKFLKQVIRQWREQQTQEARQQRESLMSSDWRPSHEAMELLAHQAGINSNFVEDAIPEFILYWREKGSRSSTWNSQFIQHVRRQWIRYTSTIEHESEPRVIPATWQPSDDLYEILNLANIPRLFAEQQVPPFVLYWRETATPHNSWNTKFLQHVKRQWSYDLSSKDLTNKGPSNQAETYHGKQQRSDKSISTRNTSIVQDLTDRSWAS